MWKNNVVFEDSQVKLSWSALNKGILDSEFGKENRSPRSANRQLVEKSTAKIDAEIEDVEKEIKRLTSRLEGLRLEKLAQSVKIVDKRGKVVAAKFMDSKPNENVKNRRGVSLGPAEIFGSTRRVTRPDITPVGSMSDRRKSCFWKLQEVDEVRAIKKSMSVSPKISVSKIDGSKQAMTSVGIKKGVKRENLVVCPIQPKRLFKDGEKPKKSVKPVRKVASRYSLGGTGMKSVPENDKNDGKIVGSGKEVKKKWEVPSEIVVSNEEFSPSVAEVVDGLPRIRTDRRVNETPRDSGPAKKVVELIGKKSFFSCDEDTEVPVCQALDFGADVE